MQAVSESASDRILVLVDELIGEGHSPTHFARQLVRFLRNVTVAKIAGRDSALLQISSDERARAGRIAELFSEEELARHLQIMLRTHGELGYRQEQRFHLELGLLKMAHAQRLLPIEQLLSDAAASSSGPSRTAPRPMLAPPSTTSRSQYSAAESGKPSLSTSARSSSVSPFAADSARKSGPKAETASDPATFAGGGARATQPAANIVIMGSAAPALAELPPESDPQTDDHGAAGVSPVQLGINTVAAPEVIPGATRGMEVRSVVKAEEASIDSLRDAVIDSLRNQQMLVSILEAAEWTLNGNLLLARVAASNTMIEMSFTAEARRLASAAASGRAGKPIKMLVEPGGSTQAPLAPRKPSNGSARSRAEQDPIVQRMKEKFGAEIRTVIDYREKG